MASFLDLLKATIGQDIAWTHYFWGTRPDFAVKYRILLHKRNGLGWELAKHLAKIGLSVKNRLCFTANKSAGTGILFYVDSINQLRAVGPIREKTSQAALWVDGKLPGDVFFPSDLARLAGLFFLPLVFWRVLVSSKPQGWTLRYGLSGYLEAYGYFLIGVMWLKKLAPKALVLANDHCANTRAMIYAAHYLSLPTFYVQHAPVTADFPPLEVDYALLDGEDALAKYTVKNPACRIYLIGMARRAALTEAERAKLTRVTSECLGIAFSDIEPETTITSLVKEARRELPDLKVILRPHPANSQRFPFFRSLAQQTGCEYSDPVRESSWEFLHRADILVGGNSGILLEAAFAGVVPLQHEALTGSYDHYGYVRAGVVRPIRSISEVKALRENILKVRQDLIPALAKFDITFGTALDGRASELAAEILNQAALKRESRYREIPISYLEKRCFMLGT